MVAENKNMVASVLVGGFLALTAGYMTYRRFLLSIKKEKSRQHGREVSLLALSASAPGWIPRGSQELRALTDHSPFRSGL